MSRSSFDKHDNVFLMGDFNIGRSNTYVSNFYQLYILKYV